MSHDTIYQAPMGYPNTTQLPDAPPAWDSLAVPGSPIAPPTPAVPAGAHVMPSGNWVLMRDARVLTRGDRWDLLKGLEPITGGAEKAFELLEQLLIRLITAWSYPMPVPAASRDSLRGIPLEDDPDLQRLILPAEQLLFPKDVTPDDYADPTSPTAPSGE